jgi:hypothetical protein
MRTNASCYETVKRNYRRTRCLLLAQSGHPCLHRTRPLLGVKRTYRFALQMSANDPKRTSTDVTRNPFQYAGLSRYDACPERRGGPMRRRDFIKLIGSATTFIGIYDGSRN